MVKVRGDGVLRLEGEDVPVAYDFEIYDPVRKRGGYGRVNGAFEGLSQALAASEVELRLDNDEALRIRLRDAHPVTGSRFDLIIEEET